MMVGYSLPVSKRTRPRRAMAGEEHLEQRKKKKKKNRVYSASDNVRRLVSSEGFGDRGKSVNDSENFCVNRRMEVEPVISIVDSEKASVEEIDSVTFGIEVGESVTFVGSESSGLKNAKDFSTKGTEKGIVGLIELDDGMILINEKEGFDSVNSNCSISKWTASLTDGSFVCLDLDNEDGSSRLISSGKGKGALVISPNKSMGGSSCLNSNRCESCGCSNTTEPASCSDDTIGESTGWGASPSSEEYDGSHERNYELEGSEESSSKSSSSENGKSNGSYCVEAGSIVQSAKDWSFYTNTVEHKDAFPSTLERVDLCLRGDHQLILDEQIGFRCKYCSYVKLEIKDIVPSFDTNPYGKSQKRESGSFEHVKFDDLPQDFDCDPHDRSDSRSHVGRTVWDIIPGIKNSMYPHQLEGFEFIWKNIAGGIDLDELKERKSLNHGNGCIVSHAPGTGKTRLTIVFLQTYMELNPTCRPMIIAPSSMLLTWEEEFLKWKVGIPFHNLNKRDVSFEENISALEFLIQASPSGQSVDNVRLVKLFSWKKEKSILGVSYRLFERLAGVRKISKCDKVRKVLLEIPDLVIFDEGHIPCNDDSLIWMALSKIKTERRIILSGTPFQNNFTEFYNTLRLVRPNFEDI